MKHTILVLHGYRNNAARLKYQMSPMIKYLGKHNVEFMFLDSEILYTKEADEKELTEEEVKNFGPYRKWWTTHRDHLLTQCKYDTCRESIHQVETFIQCHKNITAIMGFSQGSSLLQMLPSLPSIKKAILIGGIPVYDAVDTDTKEHDEFGYSTLHRHTDTLHIIGENDPVVSPDASQNLSKMFPNAQVYSHKGKHYVPTSKEACQTLLTYLNK